MRINIEELKSKIKPKLRPIIWRDEDNTLILLDQRKLPFEEVYVELRDPASTADAIKQMIVRGAPAIGITAAYGMVLAIAHSNVSTLDEALRELARAREILNAARPTAQNLFWATERMYNRLGMP